MNLSYIQLLKEGGLFVVLVSQISQMVTSCCVSYSNGTLQFVLNDTCHIIIDEIITDITK
jgi:hypothetical protein